MSEGKSLLRLKPVRKVSKGSREKSSAFPLSLYVNFSDISFCVSSRNHFTVAEFLMEIKSIQQETSCLPHSAFLYFTLYFEAKREKYDTEKKLTFTFLCILRGACCTDSCFVMEKQ